jgi:WD40 repeat protein/thiol-disulfide isomerase/thioredoxin
MTTGLSHFGAGLAAVTLLAAGVVGLTYLQPPEEPPAALPPLAPAPGAPTWQEAARLYGTGGYVSLSPDGRVLATFDGDHVVFWDVATWKEQARYDLRQRYGPDVNGSEPWRSHLPFSPDGRTVAVVGRAPAAGWPERPREVTLLDAATGRERGRVPGQEMMFSPTGELLAVRDGAAITLWDVAAARPTRTLPIGKPLETHHLPFAFAPDGALLYAVSTEGGKLIEVATGRVRGATAGYLPLFSKDGRALATILPGPAVKLWDTATGQERATLGGFITAGCVFAFSPDSAMFITSGWDLFLMPNGELDRQAMNRPRRYPRAALDVRLWDVATGRELVRLPGRIRLHRAGHFTTDGRTVVYQRLSGSEDDMEIVFWDVAARRARVVLRERGGLELQMLSPDGATLFATSGDPSGPRQTLRQWDIATGRELPRPPQPETPGDHTFIAAHAWDGKTFVRSITLPGGKVGQSPDYEMRVYRLTADPLTVVTRGKKPQPEPAPEEPEPASPAEREWDRLTKDSQAADRDFAARAAQAKTPDEQRALGEARMGSVEGFADRALAIARKYPDASAGVEALLFALRSTNGGTDGRIAELGRAAVTLARQNYLSSEQLGKVVPWLQHQQRDDAEELLQAAFEQSPHRAVRGRAAFWLARALTERAEAARLFQQMPELADHPAVNKRPAAIARLRATDPAAVERRAERLYEALKADYADVPKQVEIPDDLIGPAADQALFALRHLGVGQAAPHTEGTDLDGKAFALSEYRGKVVVLVFCGHWCGPCRTMEPHTRALVKRFADQPFALLEVNSDEDRDDVKERMKAEGNPWRSWFDGGREGPIHKRWNVTRWPTVIVLDAKGVIRYKDLRDRPLAQAVEALLKETVSAR